MSGSEYSSFLHPRVCKLGNHLLSIHSCVLAVACASIVHPFCRGIFDSSTTTAPLLLVRRTLRCLSDQPFRTPPRVSHPVHLMSSRSRDRIAAPIPILLLKTRSQPHDAYEEYFSRPLSGPCTSIAQDPDTSSSAASGNLLFQAQCIPVLTHSQNDETLGELGALLQNGRFKERYGGMIFTSQRAVEAWADTIAKVQKQSVTGSDLKDQSKTHEADSPTMALDSRSGERFETDILTSSPFPLYVVGPATERALTSLISSLPSESSLRNLRPLIRGAETGSGSNLAPFILNHYNSLHSQNWFTWHDAPRLPFIPLLGMGSENYSRRRLETDDARLQKRPLLFLVGEQRRDIIPRTLMDEALGNDKITVEEVEVYKTQVRNDFRRDFEKTVQDLSSSNEMSIMVVVIFSPQGSGDMLRALGLLDESGQVTEKAKMRWEKAKTIDKNFAEGQIFIIATIGPTTRDYLIDQFSFEPDVCAKTPSPDGVGIEVKDFLTKKGLA